MRTSAQPALGLPPPMRIRRADFDRFVEQDATAKPINAILGGTDTPPGAAVGGLS